MAASVSLPMAWISLGKLMLFLGCLVYFAWSGHKTRDQESHTLWSVRLILVILITFALSLFWSKAPSDIALMALIKHSKLLEVAMLVMLIRNAREARLALLVFFGSQAFLILSSWIMAAGYRVPWATSNTLVPEYKNVVYSTYLDQTLIFAAAAAVFWHLRHQWRKAPWVAGLLAVSAIANNLFLQVGKTGYLASLMVLTLAVMWEIPPKWRITALLVFPVLMAGLMYASSAKFQSKVAQVMTESQSYSQQGDAVGSSGFRLNAWHRSLQAMAEQPLIGHGVGSWTLTVKRIEGPQATNVYGDGLTSNPHQEFLLWGVELGVGGTLLLILLVVALVRDAMQFETPLQRALISVVAVMVLGCSFNSSLYDALIGDFFCVTLGLLLALGVRHQSPACLPDTPAPQKVNA
ncbi:O-antigen ligase family protein [Rhodoferax lithotrophicus]|uniref:O-antigen ligase family protein n=1 Tax=Rhodoferax lithotrophicus TaxID=2798804 RepID=UPI001CC75DAB|nr:O-antigen ligase family protein [Rhodoferax sp. MIZ03]